MSIVAVLVAFLNAIFGSLGNQSFLAFIKQLIGLTACVGIMVLATGCQPNTEPIERATTSVAENIIKPAVEKAAAELTTRTGALQGQGSLINPGYKVRGYGIFGTGVVYEVDIHAQGVSANVAGHSQMDQGQETTDPRAPGDRTPSQDATSPAPAATTEPSE